ncbi:S41 family peptidase [Chloroflexota bacterium]
MFRSMRILIVALIMIASLTVIFGVSCARGTNVLPNADSGIDVVEEAWGIIFQDYVDKDRLDASMLSQAAIKGMVEALDDPYTSYLGKEAYQMNLGDIRGGFEGIGAYVTVKDGHPMIVAPFTDSPAAEAGIRAGDIILEIDGESTLEMTLTEAVLHIRGPEGTSVMLLILHEDQIEVEEIEIIRAEIQVPSVLFEARGDIAYIAIGRFIERTNEELYPVLESMSQEGATGIILDLRSNPGGLLEAVVDVTSRFLREGIVLYVVDNQGKRTSLSVSSESMTTDLPMIVLVDSYSASGSEVLAGALQDHARAIIVGTQTYGKGSVNTLHQLRDGSGLIITNARWLTPNGRLIEGEGISPDYELEFEGEDAIHWAMDYLENN